MNNLTKLKESSQKLSILYIEDDLKLQSKVSSSLKQLFSNVFQAYDGTDGFSQFNHYKPDIILTDLTLSKKNSFSMIMDIKEIDDSIKIIVLSEIDDNYELLESLEIENVYLLSKPLNLMTLYKTISNVLESESSKNNSKNTVFDALINTAIKDKETIQCINEYKGIVLKSDASLLRYENNVLKIRTTGTQKIASIEEQKIILHYNNQYVLCNIVEVNKNLKILSVTFNKFIEYEERSSLNKRLKVDKIFKTTITSKNLLLEMRPLSVTYDFLVLENSNLNIKLEENDKIELTIGFEIDGPSSLISEKKFTKIFASGIIMRIDNFKKEQNIIVSLEIKKSGQNVFKRYLKERELSIIKEFKYKLKKING